MDPVPAVVVGVSVGTLARAYMLRVDYRMYPSYPQGYVIHLTFGAVAAFLGALAVPTLAAKDFAAASFLALAATQFREVRSLERSTLENMEPTELVPRGSAYIEGIARVFEARNYLALISALVATLVTYLIPVAQNWRLIAGALAGLLVPVILRRAMQGARISDIAKVRSVPLEFNGPLLMVGGVGIMNVGLPKARAVYLEQGMGLVIEPKGPNAKATLANLGQRQAIAHDAAGQLGIRMDVDEPEFTPLVRRNSETGILAMAMVAPEKNTPALIKAVSRVPVLEGARRQPLSSKAGQMVD